jgi:hypothetical protein
MSTLAGKVALVHPSGPAILSEAAAARFGLTNFSTARDASTDQRAIVSELCHIPPETPGKHRRRAPSARRQLVCWCSPQSLKVTLQRG